MKIALKNALPYLICPPFIVNDEFAEYCKILESDGEIEHQIIPRWCFHERFDDVSFEQWNIVLISAEKEQIARLLLSRCLIATHAWRFKITWRLIHWSIETVFVVSQ